MNREVELSTAQAQGYSGFSAGISQGASPVIPTATQTQSSQPPADSDATDLHGGHLMEKRISALTEPDGNIYRGWAIGFHKGGRVWCLTILVMVIQIFGPIFMLFWASREAKKFDFLTIWEYENRFQNKTKVNADPFYSWFLPESWASSHWWTANELNELWQVKILGCLFMIILFFSNDSALLRADIQTDKLRRYWDYEKYEKRRREGEEGEKARREGSSPGYTAGWMWIDAVVNSWATVLTGVAALPLFLVSTGIKALILDAFGLLFLAGLDDYGGDVEYGVEDDDWNGIVAENKEKWREEKATDHFDKETEERWFKNPTYEVGTQNSVFEKQIVSDPDDIPFGLERGVDGSLRCTKFDSSVHSRPMWTKVNKDDINCDTNKLYTTAEKKERLEEERDLEQARLWRNLPDVNLEARYDEVRQAKNKDEEIELYAEDGPLYQPWSGNNYRPWTVEEQARAWRWHIDLPDKEDILPRYDHKLSPEALEEDHVFSDIWCTRFLSGDFVYMIARAINYVSICMALPIYVIFHLEEKEENNGEGKTPKSFWPMVFETRYYWFPAGGFIMLVAWLPDLITYFWNYYRTKGSPWHKDYYAPRSAGARDCWSFGYLVCLRRPDPRFRVDRLD